MTELKLMIDSTNDLHDSGALRERMAEEGYLFFSKLVDPERALGVKRDIIRLLREHHIMEDGPSEEAVWSGGPEPTESEYMAVYDRIVRLDSYLRLAESPEIISLLEGVCEEGIQIWNQKLIRLVYPDPDSVAPRGVGAHQDGDPKLGYSASRFYTCWIALMEIDSKVGGLAVAPKSHKRGLLQSEGAVASSAKDSAKDTEQLQYGLDPSQLDWATANYPPGGAVIFHCLTVHRGMANHSDRIRLSCDYRYQPVSDTASWMAETLGPDVRRVAQQIDELLAGRAIYITEQPTPDILGEVRTRMLQEKSTSLERAQELVRECRG